MLIVSWLLLGAAPVSLEVETATAAQAVEEAHAQPVPADVAPATGSQLKGHTHGRRSGLFLGKLAGFRLRLEGGAAGSVAAIEGLSVRPGQLLATVGEINLLPSATRRPFRLSLPAGVLHRETSGADLRETRARLDLALAFAPFRHFKAAVDAGVRVTLRPRWPDLYQPQADGVLARTDRYSYVERRARLEVSSFVASGQYLALSYAYGLVDYDNDPGFDAFGAPTHLVPGDHEAHRIRAVWWAKAGPWKLSFKGEGVLRSYFFAFARDAGTGRTHAGPGGAQPNPLQTLVGAEPAVGIALTLMSGKLRLGVAYGYEITVDPYQGYYSMHGHRPECTVLVRLSGGIELAGKVSARLLGAGEGGYAASSTHPPLTGGDVLYDERWEGRIAASAPIGHHIRLVVEATAVRRRTNYPDYAPGIFPRTRSYEIAWSFDNTRVEAGIAYSL